MSKRPVPEGGLEDYGESLGNGVKFARLEGDSEVGVEEKQLDEDDRFNHRRRMRPNKPVPSQKRPQGAPLQKEGYFYQGYSGEHAALLYKPNEPLSLSRNLKYEGDAQLVQVIIPPQYLSCRNPQVKSRQLWGVDIYTEDSDLVAVLMHTGFYSSSLNAVPSTVHTLHALVRPLPPRERYASDARNSIRSRAWGSKITGCSYKVERCWVYTHSAATVALEACLDGPPGFAPTFTPAQADRAMNTRSNASSAEKRQRTMQEVTLQYNLCNEPWLKYSMAAVADRGLKPHQLTSSRLHKEVLLLETARCRYELSLVECNHINPSEEQQDRYRWAECKNILSFSQLRAIGMPLPEEHLEVLASSLAWEDFQWGPQHVKVQGKTYAISRLHFSQRRKVTGNGVVP